MALKRRPVSGQAPPVVSRWGGLPLSGYSQVAERLDGLLSARRISDVQWTRAFLLLQAAAQAGEPYLGEMVTWVDSVLAHPDMPLSRAANVSRRVATHDLVHRAVLLGRVPADRRTRGEFQQRPMWVTHDMLRTSMLVVGPPGFGKTSSVAVPVVESLCLGSLTETASVVVVDVKGDDFADPGQFDVEINLAEPSAGVGIDLYGGSDDPHAASDRLASALLPPISSPDKAYFIDSARNALYDALEVHHAAHGRLPDLTRLLGVLTHEPRVMQSIRDRLKNSGRADVQRLIAAREAQLQRREDPAASLLERLRQLDRPRMRALLAPKGRRRFSMSEINEPVRVRVVLDEGGMPDASLFLARLVVSQFVQTVSSASTNRSIFKGLVIDEAGRYVDDYVARGLQRVRSNNAGLVLLTQTLSDLPPELRNTVFGSTGCKVTFGGLEPTDAQYFADYWGKEFVTDYQTTVGRNTGTSREDGLFKPTRRSETESFSVRTSKVERYVWSPSDLINDVPLRHAVMTLTQYDGKRTPPLLVDLTRAL